MAQSNPMIYQSLGQVWRTLAKHKVKDAPEVSALMRLCCDQGLVSDFNSTSPEVRPTTAKDAANPFLVIEGLDGTGKTTLTKFLSAKLNMKCMRTPPVVYDVFLKARDYFDDQPETVRRAYYALGNYLAAMDVVNCKQAVVMDRFWHSTAAYAKAHEIKSGGSLNVSDLIWPSDLLQPDLVIFLQVSEKERIRRHSTRKDFTNTKEEQTIAEDEKFRQSLVKCYQSIKGPEFKELFIDGIQQESESKILAAVIDAFPNLKNALNTTSSNQNIETQSQTAL